jgi:hypothetical protein
MIFLFFISSWSSKKMWVPSATLYSKMKKGGGEILEQNETMWKWDMVGS